MGMIGLIFFMVLLNSVKLNLVKFNLSIQRTNAQLLYSIGCVDSALEIFLRLHLWDDVIACYQRLGKHGKVTKPIILILVMLWQFANVAQISA